VSRCHPSSDEPICASGFGRGFLAVDVRAAADGAGPVSSSRADVERAGRERGSAAVPSRAGRAAASVARSLSLAPRSSVPRQSAQRERIADAAAHFCERCARAWRRVGRCFLTLGAGRPRRREPRHVSDVERRFARRSHSSRSLGRGLALGWTAPTPGAAGVDAAAPFERATGRSRPRCRDVGRTGPGRPSFRRVESLGAVAPRGRPLGS
jgi:hypothetical protein